MEENTNEEVPPLSLDLTDAKTLEEFDQLLEKSIEAGSQHDVVEVSKDFAHKFLAKELEGAKWGKKGLTVTFNYRLQNLFYKEWKISKKIRVIDGRVYEWVE